MAKTNFAPWSAETAQGIKTDPVDSNIKVRQEVVPAITVGTVNALTGEWTGIIESDTAFTIDTTHAGVPNGASVLCPQAQPDFIDMTGYSDIFIAIKNSSGSTFAIQAVMGPDTHAFANLTPVNAAAGLRGQLVVGDQSNLLSDTNESLQDGVWNIFYIGNVLKGQKLLQFKITNSSGGNSDIQFASLRVV